MVRLWIGIPELSRKVKLSSTVPALIELWVKH